MVAPQQTRESRATQHPHGTDGAPRPGGANTAPGAGGTSGTHDAALAAYEAIAETRPRIRRDVLYTQTPGGVHFHNARGGFSVVMPSAYRFASIIVPHLTGANTVAALCAGLGDKQRDMITQLVGTLYARGFARDAEPPAADAPAPEPAVAERFAPQIDYVDHYADDAAARFLRFRTARVAVLGEDQVARWAALSLIRNGCATVAVPAGIDTVGNDFADVRAEAAELTGQGCPVDLRTLERAGADEQFSWSWADLDGYDIVLVTGEHAARRAAALADVPAGRMLVPAWAYGGSTVIGPLLTDTSTGCLTCAALRLEANGDPADAAALWAGLAPAAPHRASGPAPARGPVAAMIGNLLGYEVFRLTTQALAAETRGQLVVQHLDSLDTVAEPLLPHPACPSCATRRPPVDEVPRLASLDEELGQGAGAGAGSGSGSEDGETSAGAAPAGAAARPVSAVEDAQSEDAAQAALAEITDRAVLVQETAGVFRRFDDETWAQTPLKVSAVELGAGHGGRRTVAAFDVHHVAGARLRALLRAAEVYAEHVVPLHEPLTGPALESARAAWASADPERLAVASGLGPRDLAAWHAATSLLDGRTVLVPAAALRTFGPYNADRAAEPTAAGTGAGRTPAEATARGVLSALAHATLSAALHGRTPVRTVDPAALEAAGDAELTFLVRSAANLRTPLEILDLGALPAHPAPVVLAKADGRWAVAAGLRRRDALLEAIRDVLGAAQLAREERWSTAGADAAPPAAVVHGVGVDTDSGRVAAAAHEAGVEARSGQVAPLAHGAGAGTDPGRVAAGAHGGPDTGDPLLPDLDPAALTAEGAAAPDPDAGSDWAGLAAALREAGHDLFAVPAASPDLAAGALHVTRVLLSTAGPADDH